jgi:hypothetical protein
VNEKKSTAGRKPIDVMVMFRMLKRFPTDLNRRDSQEVTGERVFVH